MEAQITISRYSGSEEGVLIEIQDSSSGLVIVEARMSILEFGKAITGLSYCKGEINRAPTQFTIDNIGKKRETKSIFVDKPTGYDNDGRSKQVMQSISDSGELIDGWEIFSNGCMPEMPEVLFRIPSVFIPVEGRKCK